MTKHTPGPWRANHDGAFIYAKYPPLGTGVICSTERASDIDYTPTYSTVNEGERVANERLIAAAPDTTDALKESTLILMRMRDTAYRTVVDAETCPEARTFARATLKELDGAIARNQDVIWNAEGELPEVKEMKCRIGP